MSPGYQPNIDRFKHRTAALNYLSRPARVPRCLEFETFFKGVLSKIFELAAGFIAGLLILFIAYITGLALFGVGP